MKPPLKVAKRYVSAFADPLRLKSGDRVAILPGTSEWPGWIRCRADDGKTGWVPEAYLSATNDGARLRRDYDATELTVDAGETIQRIAELAGWVWGTDERGKTGWVPQSHLDERD
jgi:SH3-like domain-containing protein